MAVAASILVAACGTSAPATPGLAGAPNTEGGEELVAVAQRARAAVVVVRPARAHQGGSGTGFFFSHDGYILTNAHIVDDLTAIEVVLLDGRTFAARLVGMAESKKPDVAVLKIDAPDRFPALAFGPGPEAGDTVVAVGHPAMSTFWVPIVGRVFAVEGGSIRVDMPSFFGMSGGPVVGLGGRVVGLLFGTTVPRVEHPEVAPLELVQSWEEFGELKPPVSAVSVETLRAEVGRILQAQR